MNVMDYLSKVDTMVTNSLKDQQERPWLTCGAVEHDQCVRCSVVGCPINRARED